MLMGRRLRNTLPIHSDLLEPKFPIKTMQAQLRVNQQRVEKLYNISKQPAESFSKGQSIWFQLDTQLKRNWTPGIIVQSTMAPNSYRLQSENGQFYRRNAIHIRKRSEDSSLTDQSI